MEAWLSFAVAVLGVLVIALSEKPKLITIGTCMLLAGLLAFLMHMDVIVKLFH